MPATLYLAQEMGEGLGPSKILQRKMPQNKSLIHHSYYFIFSLLPLTFFSSLLTSSSSLHYYLLSLQFLLSHFFLSLSSPYFSLLPPLFTFFLPSLSSPHFLPLRCNSRRICFSGFSKRAFFILVLV